MLNVASDPMMVVPLPAIAPPVQVMVSAMFSWPGPVKVPAERFNVLQVRSAFTFNVVALPEIVTVLGAALF